MTALLSILKFDDLAGLENELQNGLEIDKVFRYRSCRVPEVLNKGPTLACVAAYFGSVKCFRYLFINEASMLAKDEVGRNIVHFACCGGNPEILNLLSNTLSANSFNETDMAGNTCLHYAVMNNKITTVFWLWSIYGIKLSVTNRHGISPLHIAACNEEAGILEFLCKNGCNINQKNENGETPLHFAAKKSSCEIIYKLLQNGADSSLKNNQGCVPYQCATFPHIQSILLESSSSGDISISH